MGKSARAAANAATTSVCDVVTMAKMGCRSFGCGYRCRRGVNQQRASDVGIKVLIKLCAISSLPRAVAGLLVDVERQARDPKPEWSPTTGSA